MFLVLSIFIASICSHAYSYDFKDDSLGYHLVYKQQNYQLVDPQGDLSLIRRVQQYPKIIYLSLFKKSRKLAKLNKERFKDVGTYQEEFDFKNDPVMAKVYRKRDKEFSHYNKVDINKLKEEVNKMKLTTFEKEKLLAQKINDKILIEGRNRPISKTRIVEALTQVIVSELENGIIPKKGKFHKWSPEFKDEYGRLNFSSLGSKMLISLAIGKTYLYMKTDKELELLDEMRKQDDNSLSLIDLFRMSYRINDGDVYLSLLTIENVMSIHWKTKNRMNLDFVFPLRQITNRYEGRGDRFGSWYHLFGMILYGYSEGLIKSAIVGNTESIGSHMLDEGDERQEDWINYIGGPIGASLYKVIKKKKYFTAENNPELENEAHYLKLGEDFRDRIAFYSSPGLESKINLQRMGKNGGRVKRSIYVTSTEKDYNSCKVEVIPSYSRYKFNSKKIKTFTDITFQKGERTKLYLRTASKNFLAIKNYRIIISNCANTNETLYITSEKPKF